MTVLNEIEDANAILNYVKTDPHVRNIYLVGHSQGGVVASMLAGLYPDLIKKGRLITGSIFSAAGRPPGRRWAWPRGRSSRRPGRASRPRRRRPPSWR